MRKIPKKLREEMAADPYYKACARADFECKGRITWEHAFTYAGKQINEKFAIIPLCEYHHLGEGLVKIINQAIAARRATKEDREKYPNLNWPYILKYRIPKPKKQRSIPQNSSIHLYCTKVAKALNRGGYSVESLVTQIMEIPFNMTLVKELIWRRAQLAHVGKKSTKEITTKDIDKIYEVVNRFLADRYKLHVPFPSLDELARRRELGIDDEDDEY